MLHNILHLIAFSTDVKRIHNAQHGRFICWNHTPQANPLRVALFICFYHIPRSHQVNRYRRDVLDLWVPYFDMSSVEPVTT